VDLGPFEWDPKRNRANRQQHGIDFTDVVAIFGKPCSCGVYCWRRDRRRIISARKATRSESTVYWGIVYGNT